MIRTALSALGLGLSLTASVAACGSAPELDGEQLAETQENALTFKGTSSRAKPVPGGSFVSPGDPQRACTCGDHPKPKYTCNNCNVIQGRCWCSYGLTSAGGGN